jgi:uncharacterized protein YkwD
MPAADAGMPQAADAGQADSGVPTPSASDVPATDYCIAAANWDPTWAQFESEVLRLTNEARAKGADCGEEGRFGSATALTMNPILRCAARLHSADMGEAEFFDHTNLDGVNPFQRMQMAGFSGQAMGENIAKGQQSPSQVVNGWIDSDGHCRNIMDPNFTDLGVGYWEGEGGSRGFNGNKLWTQNFGRPRTARN